MGVENLDADDEQAAEMLAACDEALARGDWTMPEALRSAPSGSQDGLRGKLACVRMLRRLWGKAGEESAHRLPARLGRFEVRRELGRGGFGIVYQAFDPQLARDVALKLPRQDLLFSSALRERFQIEARAAAGLDHPNIVPVYETGEIGPTCYIASAYCPGLSLEEWLRQHKEPAAAEWAADLVAALADAVQHAHDRGVLHRDLKPGNILLTGVRGEGSGVSEDTPSGVRGQGSEVREDRAVASSLTPYPSPLTPPQPKITDFGLAKLLDDEVAGLTRSGDVLGTPAYMAPEQTGDRRAPIGPATDIYGLGAILYELLTGRPPFQAETALETMLQVRSAEPLSPSRLRPNCPRDLVTITLKCLEKNPAKRYPSARALADDLRRFLGGHPIQARPVGRWGRLAKWVRRHPAKAGLVLVSGLAVALLFAVLVVSDLRIRQKSKETEDALQDAITAKGGLSAALDRELQTLFFHRIRLAQAALLEGNPRQAERYLQACVPEPGQRDLRGWEWYYLKRSCSLELLTFAEHSGSILEVAFSPDGKHVASMSNDQTVKVWDSATGKVVYGCPALFPGSSMRRMVFSPDAKYLALGNQRDNALTLRAAEDGRVLHTLRGYHPTFSADGKRLATVEHPSGVLRIYDPATGEELRAMPIPVPETSGLAFLPDGLSVATPGKDGLIRVWDAESGKDRFVVQGQRSRLESIVFSGDGRLLASASADGSIKLWETADGRERFDIQAHMGPVRRLAFSADGSRLASGDLGGSVKVWDLKGHLLQALPGHGAQVTALAFGPSGRSLASGSVDKSVKIWDAAKDPQALVFRAHKNYVLATSFSPDSRRLVSAGFDGTVKVWDPATGEVASDFPGGMGILRRAGFSSDGTRVIAINAMVAMKIWDPHGKQLESHKSQAQAATAVIALSATGDWVAWANERVVSLKHLTNNEPLHLRGHTGRIQYLAFSPDGSRLASADDHMTVKVWDVATGREIGTLRGHTSDIRCLAFSADGARLASAGHDAQIRIWDVQSAQELLSIARPWGHEILALDFSPDGRRLAVAGLHAVVTLWDTESGQDVLDLPCHQMLVTSVKFSPNGRYLAAVIDDGTVRVWDGREE
jgi:WD40 repeat protein/serine/threonine protein kinase